MIKNIIPFLILHFFANTSSFAQLSPVKHFTLKKEKTEIPSDSLGSVYLYSISFEVNDDFVLTNSAFRVKLTSIDSTLSTHNYNLPLNDGIYLTDVSPNGLIKDKQSFFILLGNIKSKEELQLTADFIDSKNIIFKDILTTE